MSKGKRRKAAERSRRVGVGLMGVLDSGDLLIAPHLQMLFDEVDATSVAINNVYTRNVGRRDILSSPNIGSGILGHTVDQVFMNELIDFLPEAPPPQVTHQTIRKMFVNSIAEHARHIAHDTLVYGNAYYTVMPGIPEVLHEPYDTGAAWVEALRQSVVIQPGARVKILMLDEKPPLHSPVLGGIQVDNRTGLEPTLQRLTAV